MHNPIRHRDNSARDDGLLGPALGAALVAALTVAVLGFFRLGPLSLQMLLHLAAMNMAGPFLAVAFGRRPPASALWLATAAQMLLLWSWHAPPVQQAVSATPVLQLAGLISLLAASFAFWACLIESGRRQCWQTLAALLLTGKLACLLGALMIFAQRDLYGLPGLMLVLCSTGPSTLDDQHLAGLLMITACPLSYLVAGLIQATRLLARLDSPHAASDASPRAG